MYFSKIDVKVREDSTMMQTFRFIVFFLDNIARSGSAKYRTVPIQETETS